MDNKEDQSGQIESLLKLAEEYGLTVFTLWKYKALDKISAHLSTLVVGVGLVAIVFMVVFMATIGASLWIGAWIGKYWCGFFIVAGFYLLLGLIWKVLFHRWFKKVIANKIIKNVFK